jgi:hypothetical protein
MSRRLWLGRLLRTFCFGGIVAALWGASELQAQAPPDSGDLVRVTTWTMTVRGRATSVFPDSLVVDTPDPRLSSPATFDRHMLQRLEVMLGPGQRTRSALIGAGIGTLAMVALFVPSIWHRQRTGKDYTPTWNYDWVRPLGYAMPLAGGAVGYAVGGDRWREARLAAQELPGADGR